MLIMLMTAFKRIVINQAINETVSMLSVYCRFPVFFTLQFHNLIVAIWSFVTGSSYLKIILKNGQKWTI